MTLEFLFDQFCKERTYIKNSSPHTIAFYQRSFKTYQKVLSETVDRESPFGRDGLPTKHILKDFVTGMRERGIKPVTCNTHIRGMNSFLTWLHENDYIPENLKIKQLKCEQKVMSFFSDQQLRAIVGYKPKSASETRIWTVVLLCLDTGLRIDEALTLQRSKLDFDNLLLTVRGKGNKERTLPFSIEMRKHLFKLARSHSFDYIFCSRTGSKLMYDNCRRNFKLLLSKLGIEVEGSFHVLRRTFARNYVRSGGNLFYLMKFLGHTTLTMSRRYVELETEDLQRSHQQLSPLSRMR
jgi:integrase/recombinase XerD